MQPRFDCKLAQLAHRNMTRSLSSIYKFARFHIGSLWLAKWLSPFVCVLLAMFCLTGSLLAQGPNPSSSELLNGVDGNTMRDLANAAKETPAVGGTGPQNNMDFFSLLIKGGIFMIPIAFVSVLALTFIIERLIGLRSNKLLPRTLVRKLSQLGQDGTTVDPRVAYRICQEYPSNVGSRIIQAMLVHVGRPQSDIRSAVDEASQREADKAYAGVTWLDFCAGVGPLLGLLGTVWGLIIAFQDLSHLAPSQNRLEVLSRGIYEAMVTTLAGLMVAIPSSLFSHFFQGRITRTFQRIEAFASSFMLKFESFEGKRRFEVIGKELVIRPEGVAKSSSRTTSPPNSSSSGSSETPTAFKIASPPSHDSHSGAAKESSNLVIPPLNASAGSEPLHAVKAVPPVQVVKKSKPLS